MSHEQARAHQADDAEHEESEHAKQDPNDGADLALRRRHGRGRELRRHGRGRELRGRGLSGGSARRCAALLTESALYRGATTSAKSHKESDPPPDPPLYATRGREAMLDRQARQAGWTGKTGEMDRRDMRDGQARQAGWTGETGGMDRR